MSIFAKLFGRKRPEDESGEHKPLSGEIVEETEEKEEDENLPQPDVSRSTLAARVSDTFGSIAELLRTMNQELGAHREAARTFQEAAQAQIQLMNSLSGRLEKESEAHTALVKVLSDLPQNLRRMPENSEMQTQLMREMNESIRSRGMEVHGAFQRVNEVLIELPKTTQQQLETLNQINGRFEVLSGFSETLARIRDSVEAQAKSVSNMEDNAVRSLKYVAEMRKATVRQTRQSAFLLSAIFFLVLVFGIIGLWRVVSH